MSDTQPISDHGATAEEEANELRKVHQDDDADGGLLGGIEGAVGSLTRPLAGDRQDEGDVADDAVLNDREQRHG